MRERQPRVRDPLGPQQALREDEHARHNQDEVRDRLHSVPGDLDDGKSWNGVVLHGSGASVDVDLACRLPGVANKRYCCSGGRVVKGAIIASVALWSYAIAIGAGILHNPDAGGQRVRGAYEQEET